MIYKDCRDCKNYIGDCGKHFIDSDKHIEYTIASETYYDNAIGDYASCFEPGDRYIKEIKTKTINEIMESYTYDEIKAAFVLLEGRRNGLS